MNLAGREVIISTDIALSMAGDYLATIIFALDGFDVGGSELPRVVIVHAERVQGMGQSAIIQRHLDLSVWLHEVHAPSGVVMVLDAAGNGRPVLQLLQEKSNDLTVGIMLTGSQDGERARFDESELILRVGKAPAVLALAAAYEAGRIKIAHDLELADALSNEYRSLGAKLSSAGNLIIEKASPMKSKFDDLALASIQGLALADALWTPRRVRHWRQLKPDYSETSVPRPVGEVT